MSQEERILHQLKELHDWTLHTNKQIVRIVWMQYVLTAITLIALVTVMFK